MSNRPASEGVRLLRQAIRDQLDEHLDLFSEEWERNTKQARDWRDDTGSAAAAITAYLVGKGDAEKNFGDPAWQAARAAGSQKYGTSPENYEPHTEFVDAGEGRDRKVVILTNFVRYALGLELGGIPATPLGGNLLQISTDEHEMRFLTRVAFAIKDALEDISRR